MSFISEIQGIFGGVTSSVDAIASVTYRTDNDATSDLAYPTDYNLKSVRLISLGLKKTISGDLDLFPYLLELSYFEDLYGDSISGKLLISDAVGVITMAGMNGTEQLQLEFVKGAGGESIKSTFRVYSISDRVYNTSNNYETYVINFCSEELLMSEKYRIGKAYKGRSISSIIKEILKNTLKTKKNIDDIDGTLGVCDFVVPSKKIFDTINWLSKYALPVNKAGADMIFFENKYGYHFKSLQSLYDKEPICEYSYNPKNTVISGDDSFGIKMFDIHKLEIIDTFNSLQGTTKGTFNNTVMTVDPLLRRKEVINFNADNYDAKDKGKKLNPYTTTGSYKDRYGSTVTQAPNNLAELTAGSYRLVLDNSTQSKWDYIRNKEYEATTRSINNNRTVHNRVAQLALANYTRLKIIVSGNSNLVVGETINLNIGQMHVLEGKRNNDTYLSGKYMISAVRHVIRPGSYVCLVEVSKDSTI